MKDHTTPIELENARLPSAFRGYRKETVDAVLRRAAGDIEALLAERAALSAERDRLTAELERHRKQEEALRSALVAAEESAKAVRAAAAREAEALRSQAESDAKEIRRQAAETVRARVWEAERLRSQAEAFRLGFRAMLREHLDRLEAEEAPAPAGAHAS